MVPEFSSRTLRRWAENGDLPASKRGTGRWYVNLNELREIWGEMAARKPSVFEASLAAGDNIVQPDIDDE